MNNFIINTVSNPESKNGIQVNENKNDTNKSPHIGKAKLNSKNNAIQPLKLFIKHGEYVFAHFNDIMMIETCDHFVKVYISVVEKTKIVLRHNTLKDFLSLLPKDYFFRVNRFTVVNICRLTGGNCDEQFFEFDFRFKIKPRHALTQSMLSKIGN
jgi:LytTr DNA-binding domain